MGIRTRAFSSTEGPYRPHVPLTNSKWLSGDERNILFHGILGKFCKPCSSSVPRGISKCIPVSLPRSCFLTCTISSSAFPATSIAGFCSDFSLGVSIELSEQHFSLCLCSHAVTPVRQNTAAHPQPCWLPPALCFFPG